MKPNLFSPRTLFFAKSVKAFFFSLIFLLTGIVVLGQTATYTVSTTTAVTSAGILPSGSSAVYAQTYNTAKQLISGTNAKLTLSGYAGKRITGITLEMRSNTSSGRGSLSVVAGSTTIASIADNTFNNSAWYGAWSTGYVDVNVSPVAYSITAGQNVVFTIAATANSLYIQKFTITYENAVTTNYALTYNANGATGTAPTAVSNPSGTSITLPSTTLTRSGYTFSGWNVNSTGSGTNYAAAANYTMPAEDTTLFARWAYTITYNGNGNTGGAVPATQTNYNSIATSLSGAGTLVRTGYTFGGWKTTAAGSSPDYTAGSTYTPATGIATITLFAHWIANTATLTVSPTILSGFTYSFTNGPSPSQNFTITGNTLDGSNVSILPGDDYEISIDNGTTWLDYNNAPVNVPYTGSSLSRQVSVRLKAGLAVGNYNNTSNHIIVVSGGGVASSPEVALSGTVTACLAPTTQSTLSTFTAIGINGMTVNATAGNGLGRIIKINTTNSFTNPTSSNALPTANTVYAGSGEQVIYTGSGNSVAVTGLSHSTTYWYRVYEYNICSGNYIYTTTAPANNPRSQATLCDVPAMPNGEVDVDPSCGSVDLVYQHGNLQPQAGVSYYWQTSATGTSTANSTNNIYTVTTGGKYYVRGYNGSCWGPAFEMNDTVVILSPVSVTTHPANQSATVGATATFAVTASNVSTYQWQVSTNNGTTWTNITSANSSSYTTAATTLAMNGYRYRVRLSNSCNTVISNVVTLSVVSGPCLSEGFQSAIGYTTGNVTLGSGVWYFNDALIMNTSGNLEVQLKSDTGTYISTPVINSGVQSVAFKAYRASSTGSALQVNYSTDGGATWSSSPESPYNLNGTKRDFLATINTTVPTIIRFYRTAATVRLDDIDVTCNAIPVCAPATITATPDNGPANTVVVINGSNFTSGSTVKFGTIDADVEYISATQLKTTVPALANGNIIVDTALDCDSETAFTLIKQDASGCEVLPNGSGSGNAFASDLIFYEVYDENGGTGGTVTIYNGTNAAVNLNDYSFFRSGNVGTDAYERYGTLSGSVASGELAIIGIIGTCTISPTPTNGIISSGFNDNDGFRLMKGSVIVDEVLAPNYVGYYMKRKPTNLSPKSIYDINDWTTDDVTQCVAGVGSETPAVKTLPPVIVVQPTYTLSCDVVNMALTLTATEGYVGGNALAFQWYVLDNSGIWNPVSNNSNYSGATTANLNIADAAAVDHFQYYCQVRENTQTCYTATAATQIKSAANTWSTAQVWSGGTPVLASKIVIAGSYDTQVNGALDVCELTINSTGTMIVKADNPITVKKKIINNNATDNSFVVESDANLIQTDNIANEGNIKVERALTGMNNVSGNIDYVYWSSPVSNQPIKAFSPNTPNSGFQQYNEVNDRFTTTTDPNFVVGKGYAIRAENVLTNGYNKTYNFTGVPHNGNVSTPVLTRSPGADKGYNLVGNPYPSNIDFDKFHEANFDKIYASAFFWTNNTYTAQQMGSGYTGNNYAIYNITGGVPATYDKTNPNYSIVPNGKVKVGQAFIVQSKIAGALDFNNTMRVTDNGTFYQKNTSKNRFWLAMTSPNNLVNTILIGYVSGATDGYETDYDGELFAVGSDSFYSVLGAKKLAIQGRADSFTSEDVVPVANAFSVNGNYTITLQNPEGLFEGSQQIFLKDKLMNQYINLSTETSYTFSANKGTDATRFEIVYKDKAVLGTDELSKNHFEVYRSGSDYVIQSSKSLGRVEVYDVAGRLVIGRSTSEKTMRIDGSGFVAGMYIIKAENSGEMKTKKIMK